MQGIISRPSVVGFLKFQRRSSRMGHQGTDHVGPRDDQHSFGHNWFISSQGIIQGLNKMNHLWPNDCCSSHGPTWSLHQWPIRDECLCNFPNWMSGTLNPWTISLVTKWSNYDQTTVGHCADPHGLFLGDPYEMNAFGILKIRPPRAEKQYPPPLAKCV